jgi:hypothetical protein
VFFVQRPLAVSPTDAQRYRAVPGVLSGRFEDETFLLSLTTGQYYKLDDVGTELWQLLHEPKAFPDILSDLEHVYDIAPSTLAGDVADLMTRLLGYKVIEVISS